MCAVHGIVCDALQGRVTGMANILKSSVAVAGGSSVAGGMNGRVVVDVRAFDPALRRPMLFCIVDKLVELGSADELVLVTDHEPSGLGYQIDLRRETRGRFEFAYDRRSDGAWVAIIKPKRG